MTAAAPADLAARAAAAASAARRGMPEAHVVLWPAMTRLRWLAGSEPDSDLRSWAERLSVPDGDLPLLGTAARAATYPALLWNGERCRRAGLGRDARLALVGLAAGARCGATAATLGQGVLAGLAVAGVLDAEPVTGTQTATATTDVVAAAACVAIVVAPGRTDLRALLDLAGSMLVVGPAAVEKLPESLTGAWAGHALAAGWLAVQCGDAGLASIDGALGHTLTVLSAGPLPDVAKTAAPAAGTDIPPDATAQELLEALA